MAESKLNATETWIWRHFRLELPADWEMLQFSRNPEKGRCAFADRYRFRLEFSWHRVPGAPDFARMMSDYRTRLGSSGDDVTVEARPYGVWQGLQVVQPGFSSTRFSRYFPESGCLVEMVFLWPDAPANELEHLVLDSLVAEPEDRDGRRRWRAFGLDARVPASFVLQDCQVQPARALFDFIGPRKPARWIFRRFGLVPLWLHVSVKEWLQSQIPDRIRHGRTSSQDVSGHRLELVEGDFIPRGLLLARGPYDAAAWICPRDGRLYHLERYHHRKAEPAAAPPPNVLACCKAWRVRG